MKEKTPEQPELTWPEFIKENAINLAVGLGGVFDVWVTKPLRENVGQLLKAFTEDSSRSMK